MKAIRFERIRLDSFGALKGEYVFPQDKCILIVEENEVGKSTLVDAILVGLYGFSDTPLQKIKTSIGVEDRLMQNLQAVYLPWRNPEYYRIELSLLLDGKGITIRRDFNSNTLSVIDEQSGRDHAGEYRQKGKDTVGSRLLGMEWWDFKRSFLVRQDDINSVKDARGLTELLQRAASSHGGESTAASAVQRLQIALERYSYQGTKVKIETAIKRISENLAELENKRVELDTKRRHIDEQYNELNGIEQKQEENALKLKRLGYLAYAAESSELSSSLQKDAENCRQLADFKRELSELESYAKFPASQLANLLNWQGEMNSLRESIRKQEQSLKKDILQPIETVEKRVNTFKQFSRLNRTDLENLKGISVEFKSKWKELTEKRKQLRDEEARAYSEGMSIGEFRTLEDKFAALSGEEERFTAGLTEEVLTRENQLAGLEKDLTATRYFIRDIDERRSQVGRSGQILVALGALFAIIGAVILAVAGVGLSIVSFILAVILIVIGIRRFTSSYALNVDKRYEAVLRQNGVEQSYLKLKEELNGLQEKADGIALKFGLDSGHSLVQQYKHYLKLQQKLVGFHSLERDVKEREELLEVVTAKAKSWLMKIDPPLHETPVTPELIERHLRDCEEYFSIVDERDDLAKRNRIELEKIEATKGVLEEKKKMIKELLDDSGIHDGTVIEERVQQFKAAVSKYNRWHELSYELVPRAEMLVLIPAALREKKERAQRISIELAKLAAEDPELKPLQSVKSRDEYHDQIREISGIANSLSERQAELLKETGHFIAEYQNRYPKVLEEIERLHIKQQGIVRFKNSVALAIETLDRISREVYLQWADVLNERANELLPHLSSNYEDIKFGEDLTFTVGVKATGSRMDDEHVMSQVSRGAQDQIYLAMRIAINEYLSSSVGNLPMILDEPFANTDDERFLEAVKFLVNDISRRHQVIMLTCHRKRHEWLRRELPELFENQMEVVTLRKN